MSAVPSIRKRTRAVDASGAKVGSFAVARESAAAPIMAAYDIGYGKPPRGRPFVAGQSGNPAGRPKGAKNDQTLMNEALNELVMVRENGRERMISKRQVGARRFANKVAEGDPKAMALWIRMAGIGSLPVDRGPLVVGSDESVTYGSGAVDELMAIARRAAASEAKGSK